MAKTFREWDVDQSVLFPPNVMDLASEGHVVLDGTKMRANASRHKAMSYGRMKKADQENARQVDQWLEKADEIDQWTGGWGHTSVLVNLARSALASRWHVKFDSLHAIIPREMDSNGIRASQW